jgi:hypothetical protein
MFRGLVMRKRETIIHNVGDEPIIVQQSDGSRIIVPPGEKRSADLPSEADVAATAPSASPPDQQREPRIAAKV